jgi:hypothetical protein
MQWQCYCYCCSSVASLVHINYSVCLLLVLYQQFCCTCMTNIANNSLFMLVLLLLEFSTWTCQVRRLQPARSCFPTTHLARHNKVVWVITNLLLKRLHLQRNQQEILNS